MYEWYDHLSREETSALTNRHKNGERLRGNSWVYKDENETRLVSYDTEIIRLVKSGKYSEIELYVNQKAFEYSRTTCRHISEFASKYLRTYGIDYYTIRGFIVDAAIGEFIELGNVWLICI